MNFMLGTTADAENAKAVVAAAEAVAKERSLWCPGATERTYQHFFC